VFDVRTGPIGSAAINLWIQQERFGYSYWWANGPLRSDSGGHFLAPNVPDSQATIFAVKDGYVQPCVVHADLRGDLAVSVEMISTMSFETSTPSRPQTLSGPATTGTVFESTDAGRRPVAGADLWLENGVGVGLATSRTDPRGEFYLCNLPNDAYAWVSKSGFETWEGPLHGSDAESLAIELKRR